MAILERTPPGDGHQQCLTTVIRGSKQTGVTKFAELKIGVLIANKASLLDKGKVPRESKKVAPLGIKRVEVDGQVRNCSPFGRGEGGETRRAGSMCETPPCGLGVFPRRMCIRGDHVRDFISSQEDP